MEITTELLGEWAEQVRDAYIGKQVAPTESVAAISEANDLNRKQVMRLCEQSNLTIKRALKQGKIDDVKFPLADAAKVIEVLQPDFAPAPVVEDEGDVIMDESDLGTSKLSSFAEYVLTHVEDEGKTIEKTAAFGQMTSELTRRLKKARFDITMQEQKVAGYTDRIIEYLADELRKEGSIDHSYSVVRARTDEPDLVRDMYKAAYRMFNKVRGGGQKEPELLKVAEHRINDDAQILRLFRGYIKEARALEGMEKRRDHLSDELGHAKQRLAKTIVE